MPAIEGDFLMFRETLTELECLVKIWGKCKQFSTSCTARVLKDGIVYMLELLNNSDLNTSESNAIEELERLVEMRCARHYLTDDDTSNFRGRHFLDKMIGSKIDFIKNGSSSRAGDEDGFKPMAALERLAAVNKKLHSQWRDFLDEDEVDRLLESKMDGLLESKIREVHRSDQSDTASLSKLTAASDQSSPISERGLPIQCGESNTAANFPSGLSSWLQYQDNAHMEDDDCSTIDVGKLTPTSTIVSELPDPNGG